MARALPPPISSPEGALIRRVRESIRPRLSIPAAAERADISEATWGNVERGYRTAKSGQPLVKVTASPGTLAHMAYAVGITPSDLEGVGRADAADVLREMQGPDLDVVEAPTDHGLVMIPVPADMPEDEREELRIWGKVFARFLEERREGGTT